MTKFRMIKKWRLSCLLGCLLVFTVQPDLYAVYWTTEWNDPGSIEAKKHQTVCQFIKNQMGLEKQLVSVSKESQLISAYDFAYVRDIMVETDMWRARATTNFSFAILIGALVSYSAGGYGAEKASKLTIVSADAIAKAKMATSTGLATMATAETKIAAAAAKATSKIAATTAIGGAVGGTVIDKVLSFFGCSIADIACSQFDVATYDQLIKHIHRMKSDFGMSDHYLFAKMKTIPTKPELDSFLFPVALGTPMQIHILTGAPSPLKSDMPLIRLSKNIIDFRRLGTVIQEFDSMHGLLPGTVQSVFAFEKINNQWVCLDAAKKKKYTRISVGRVDKKKWSEPKDLFELRPHVRYGAGGVREVHLCSPINKGKLFTDGQDDFLLAVVLNRDTVEILEKPERRLNIKEEAQIKLRIKGLYDNDSRKDKIVTQPSKKHVYTWKKIMEEIFKGIRLTGAGIKTTHVEHGRNGTVLRFTPRRSGKVKLVIDTIDEDVPTWDIANVGGSIEGDWELKVGSSTSVIRISCEGDTCKGKLIVDNLQHFAQGEIIWKDLEPHNKNTYKGEEVQADGIRSRIVIWADERNQTLRLVKPGATIFLHRAQKQY